MDPSTQRSTPRAALPLWRRKLRLVSAYARGRPVLCAWQVSYACNFRCAFCPYWKDHPGDRGSLSPQEIRRGASVLADMGSLLISVAGGEPLLRPDLPEIIRALARWHLPVMTTNGWHMDARTARDLWEAGLCGAAVSLDYADARRHDRRRGVRGAFDRAVAAVRHLAAQRVHDWQRVTIMCVLMHDNLGHIEPLLRLARRHRAFLSVQPYCRLKTGDVKYVAPSGAAAKLLRLKRRHPNFLSSHWFLSRFDRMTSGGVPGCRAGRAFFNIDQLGRAAICVEKRHQPLGRIAHMDASTLRRRLSRAANANRCQACWYNCRGEVEALYSAEGLLRSLPFLLDARGAPDGDPRGSTGSANGSYGS